MLARYARSAASVGGVPFTPATAHAVPHAACDLGSWGIRTSEPSARTAVITTSGMASPARYWNVG